MDLKKIETETVSVEVDTKNEMATIGDPYGSSSGITMTFDEVQEMVKILTLLGFDFSEETP